MLTPGLPPPPRRLSQRRSSGARAMAGPTAEETLRVRNGALAVPGRGPRKALEHRAARAECERRRIGTITNLRIGQHIIARAPIPSRVPSPVAKRNAGGASPGHLRRCAQSGTSHGRFRLPSSRERRAWGSMRGGLSPRMAGANREEAVAGHALAARGTRREQVDGHMRMALDSLGVRARESRCPRAAVTSGGSRLATQKRGAARMDGQRHFRTFREVVTNVELGDRGAVRSPSQSPPCPDRAAPHAHERLSVALRRRVRPLAHGRVARAVSAKESPNNCRWATLGLSRVAATRVEEHANAVRCASELLTYGAATLIVSGTKRAWGFVGHVARGHTREGTGGNVGEQTVHCLFRRHGHFVIGVDPMRRDPID